MRASVECECGIHHAVESDDGRVSCDACGGHYAITVTELTGPPSA